MNRVLSLKTFVIASLLLFLATSYENTRLLAANFHGTNPLLPWAFAGAVELGIIGLSIGIIVRRKHHRPARGYAAILVGVLALSVTANFLMGAQTFYPEFQVMAKVRAWSLWWLLPLAFSAAVPVLIFAFSELLATLVLEDAEAALGTTTHLATSQTASRNHPGPSEDGTVAASDARLGEMPRGPDTTNLVARVVALYQQQPETPLAQLARELGVSSSTASRARIQAMRQGMLTKVSRSRYTPNGHHTLA